MTPSDTPDIVWGCAHCSSYQPLPVPLVAVCRPLSNGGRTEGAELSIRGFLQTAQFGICLRKLIQPPLDWH